MSILASNNVHKNYGSIQALKGVTLTCRGRISHPGANGSVKTTLLGIILDVLNRAPARTICFDERPTKASPANWHIA